MDSLTTTELATDSAAFPVDIIIYALIAGALVIFLRSVLGTRHGSERQRPNPFAHNPNTQEAEDSKAVQNPEERARINKTDKPSTSTPSTNSDDQTPSNIDAGLVQIAIADRNFDTHLFLENAKDAFAIVVAAFADGDRATLKDLLSQSVYNSFDSAIAAREKLGHKAITEVHAVRKADIIEAKLDRTTAVIGLRFVADESYALYDSDDKLIGGNPDRVIEMTDVWFFSRDTRSHDPRWFVTETRDDLPEDDARDLPEAK